MAANTIRTLDALRTLYAEPRERAVKKQLAALDPHARRYIQLSPFVVLASCSVLGDPSTNNARSVSFAHV